MSNITPFNPNAPVPQEPAPAFTTTTSPEIGEIAGALAKAQGALVPPPRDREVRVETKAGRTYTFRYATLSAITDAARKPLAENGLSYTQTIQEAKSGRPWVKTTLMHSSGQWISSNCPLLISGGGASNQEFGSALTYMRRYALSALLGIVADEDDDANHADGNSIRDQRDRRPPPPRTERHTLPSGEVTKVHDAGTAQMEYLAWRQKLQQEIEERETGDALEELWRSPFVQANLTAGNRQNVIAMFRHRRAEIERPVRESDHGTRSRNVPLLRGEGRVRADREEFIRAVKNRLDECEEQSEPLTLYNYMSDVNRFQHLEQSGRADLVKEVFALIKARELELTPAQDEATTPDADEVTPISGG